MEQLFDGVPFHKLIERVELRKRRGTRLATCKVPEQKKDFPKVLCLDMNKWIDLARAHYRSQNGANFADALQAIRRSVRQQRLIVPIAGANALELMEVRDERRRRELARFMVELSANYCLRHEDAVTILELAIAAVTVYERRA